MSLSRHERRMHLVQAIFLWEDTLRRRKAGADTKEGQELLLRYALESQPDDFDRERFFGVIENSGEFRILLAKHAPDFPVERIAKMDRAILLLALFELLHSDVPPAVVIDEAIELAKEFGGESRFVNGVLSSINKNRKNV